MKKIGKITFIALFLGLTVYFFNPQSKAQMVPLSDATLSHVSAKGFDLRVLINTTVNLGLLDGGSVFGNIGGVGVNVRSTDPATSTSSSAIIIGGNAQSNLSAFTNFNAVNSSVNVGTNIMIFINSQIGNLMPMQKNFGVNFANSQFITY